MKQFKPQKKQSSELNITSLIDIIFILLIFFMVSSTFFKPTIEVKLPVAAHKDTTERELINLFLGSNLELVLEKEIISIESLQDMLIQKTSKNPDLAIMFHCDKSLTFEKVVKILDILKKSGVKNIAISHSSGATLE